jgi:hypothetical protein
VPEFVKCDVTNVTHVSVKFQKMTGDTEILHGLRSQKYVPEFVKCDVTNVKHVTVTFQKMTVTS